MDPLSQITGLLKPQAIGWRLVQAHDAWTIQFNPASNFAVFGQLLEGTCQLEREDGVSFTLHSGDFIVMPAPPKWTMSALGGGPLVNFKELLNNPHLLFVPGSASPLTRFIAGNFIFAASNRDLIGTLMPAVIHVRSEEAEAGRLGVLLHALGDEALADRPGRSIVMDRLLEVILLEAIRYCPAGAPVAEAGLMAGLADPKIGRALHLMHADAKRPWTLALLAREAGMSRSAFASRFAQLVGVPPIEYLANWRMTLAKSALTSEVALAEVAEIAGFQSVSAFSTAFKRRMGYSPTFHLRALSQTLVPGL